ncbi:TPA: MFS transporter [Candidatus Gastranaerophilales bacterium HUM_20]|jgi:sugar phosphate permease|nr:regulatory protein UhpC-like protein [Clostridium sp. CAG:729]DAB20248.1 MAG TPA: MFS transporter [Candidatus Gastranaerophilales bacterium HUM_20]
MANAFIEFFKEPPAKPVTMNQEEVKKTYTHYRWRIFYSSFIAYVVFHICRKNIAVALPSMGKALNLSNTELGLLGSTLYVTYGIGKFVNGVIADKANVRTFLPTALILSAICNLCFVLSAVFITPGHVSFFGLPSATVLLWVMAFFWGANGWFQSCGFPPVAKSLSYWFSNSERGTKWSLWSTSHQIGVFAAVMVSGFAIDKFGWKAAFYIPAVICIITGLWLYDRLRDKPQSLGLPDVEKYREEPVACNSETEEEKDNRSYFQIFKEHIIFNPVIWMLAIAYIFVYIIRFGTEDWLVKYLVEVKGNSLTLASSKLSSLALIGAFGAILAGVISDKVYKGNRTPINIIFLICLIMSLLAFAQNPADNNFMDFVFAAMIGMFTAGPQMLIGGLCAVESSSKKVASASIGFTGIFGYVGAALSSGGTGFMVDKFGWNGAIAFWLVSTMICIVICTVLLIYEKVKKHSKAA